MASEYNSFYIDGGWVDPSTDATITVVSPLTEQVIGRVPEGVEADVDRAVAAARRAFDDPKGWAHWAPADRATAMERLADALEMRGTETARAVTEQNGMPIGLAGAAEAGFPMTLLRYYAGLARTASFEEERAGMLSDGTVRVRREPIGVVAAIVPWNFPQTLASFKYAPALAAGCTVVMKASPETVLDSYILAEALIEAEFPAGVINIVPGDRIAGAYLVAHPGVDKVAFTGSTIAGRQVAEACARLLRPVTLELGGKSAAIILDDAVFDLTTMSETLFMATLMNNGQTCHNCTRVLAPASRYDEIVDVFTDLAKSVTLGDPMDPSIQMGPLTSARQRDRVESYIAKGIGEGGRITTGGGRPKGLEQGYFVEPTIFAGVANNHTIAQEEIFGPVLAVIPYTDLDDAVRLANDSEFGLGGSVWTADPERGLEVARRIDTGTIGINNYLPDPAGPFGGTKSSGIGRELGPEGLSSYQKFKSIYVPA
ncbi:MAG: aldehyde dehydrogenase [Sporichthyaceae bacterium]